MWIERNGFDITNRIDAETLDIKSSTNDPLDELMFEYYDAGSQNPLAVGDLITVWDETGSGAQVAQPTRNLLINTLLYSTGTNNVPNVWTLNNVLSTSCLTYATVGGYGMKATFNNVTFSNGQNWSQIYQDVGGTFFSYIYPGQTYVASANIAGSGTINNIQAFVAMQFADINHNLIGGQVNQYVTPTSGQVQLLSLTLKAPANAVYARIQYGALATVSGTNSGTIYFLTNAAGNALISGVNVEPALFVGQNLADGTPVTYPSPDCTTLRGDCTLLPDQSTVRSRWLFNGYIKDLKVDYDGTNRHYQVDCAPMGDVIDNYALITQTFESTTDKNIITTLANNYFSGVLFTTQQSNIFEISATVQTGQNISSVAFVDTTLRDVLNNLSDATGFLFFVDQYNYLWYFDTPFNYSTININVENPDYVTTFPPQNYQIEYDGSQLRNSVKVLGGQFFTVETDVFSGNGSGTTFTLASKPNQISNITIGGSTYAPTSSNKIGVKGQDTLGSNGIVVIYDPNTSVVTFQTAPASGTNNVLITYPTYRNVAVLAEDPQSQWIFNRRFVSKVTDTSITDSPTAQTRGISEIAKYSEPLTILTFDLSSQGNATNVFMQRGLTFYVSSALDGWSNQPFTVQQVEVKSKGAGVNIYSYTCGIYRPSMTDSMRHAAKALQVDTANAATTITITVETLQENMYYSESITSSAGGTGPYKYGSATYGFSAYS